MEIRWVSDDPDYYVEPVDLFDEQGKGLDYTCVPTLQKAHYFFAEFCGNLLHSIHLFLYLQLRYGTKDKQTTEQAFFNCNICECELKSVVTLRAHCKGSQHIRKALQKKKEFRDAEKRRKAAEAAGGEGEAEVDTSRFTTLFEWLDSATSEAVVGLEQVGVEHHTPWCR